MPVWTVEGAEKSTGREVIRSIDAPSEELARAEASAKGILVAAVHRAPPNTLDDLAAAVAQKTSPTSAAANVSSSSSKPLDYSAGRMAPQPSPLPPGYIHQPYPGLVTGATVLNFAGIMSWIVAGLSGGLGILLIASSIYFSATGQAWRTIGVMPSGLVFLAVGLFYFAAGAVLRMLAAAGLALRDIAVNSFRH